MLPIENGGQVAILISSSISIFIAAVSVALRLLAKYLSSGLDYSEYCIVAALFWNTALHGCLIALVTQGGFGFHLMEVITRFGPDTATFFFKGIMAFAMLWNATVCFSKLSVLLMYVQLIPVASMQKWCKWIGIVIMLWCVGDIIAAFLICRPLAKNWDRTLPGTCGSQPDFYFAMGIINIVSDIVLLALPMPYLYKLRMPLRKKLVAGTMLSIGVMTWVITIYRQTTLPGMNFEDMTYEGVLATLLSGLEPAVAIVLACLPLLRPLFGRRRTPASSKAGYDYGSSGGGALYSSKKDTRSASRGPFTELDDEQEISDNSSEVQLHPLKSGRNVQISSEPVEQSAPVNLSGIAVEKKWEVSST